MKKIIEFFKVFKKNSELREENKLLKAKIEALVEFRRGFETFYHKISSFKTITNVQKDVIAVREAATIESRHVPSIPADELKYILVQNMAKQLLPLVEFDVCDNHVMDAKELVGTLYIVKQRGYE